MDLLCEQSWHCLRRFKNDFIFMSFKIFQKNKYKNFNYDIMKRKHFLQLSLLFIFIIIIKFNWKEVINKDFLQLNKCPSCYGLHCDHLTDKNFEFSSYSRFKIFNNFFNVKNVYFGKLNNDNYVIKKLAHDDELNQLDNKLCAAVNLPTKCDIGYAINILIEISNHNVSAVIEKNPALFGNSEPLKCQHRRILPILLQSFHHVAPHANNLQHFLTLLAVNPEPIIMEAFHGIFSFPKFIEACGRTVLEEYAGQTLSSYYERPWSERASLAIQLLRIADSLTNNDIRIYLTDPSSDNFAVDLNGNVKFVDLENVILVDSKEQNLDQSIHFNEGFGCNNCFSYDYSDLCSYAQADHNYFAICKGLLSATPFSSSLSGGLLHSIPRAILEKVPSLPELIEECSHPKFNKNRIAPAKRLARTLSNLVVY